MDGEIRNILSLSSNNVYIVSVVVWDMVAAKAIHSYKGMDYIY